MVETCTYHNAEKPKIVRDQIVMNIVSDTVREKLLGQSGLTLEGCGYVPFYGSYNTISHLHGGVEYHNKGMSLGSRTGARDERHKSCAYSHYAIIERQETSHGPAQHGARVQLLQ